MRIEERARTSEEQVIVGGCIYKDSTLNNLVEGIDEVIVRPIGRHAFVIRVLPPEKRTGKTLLKRNKSVDYAVRR